MKNTRANRRTHYTTDHEAIRGWCDERHCVPAVEELRHKGAHHFYQPLILGTGEKIDDTIHPCEWDEFFRLFDDRDMVFAYEEGRAGNCVHQIVEGRPMREMGMEDRVEGRRSGGRSADGGRGVEARSRGRSGGRAPSRGGAAARR